MPTRRRFIRTTLLATGAVFVGRARGGGFARAPVKTTTGSLRFAEAHRLLVGGGDLPRFPPASRSVQTAIVGGGPAGLAALWKAVRAGEDALLLESEPTAGGTARSFEASGFTGPLGSTYFYRYSGELKEFLGGLGLAAVETAEDAQWFAGGRTAADWWRPEEISRLPLPKSDIDALRTFRDFVLVLNPAPTYPLAEASGAAIAAYDAITAREYVGRFGSALLLERMDLFSRSVLGAPLAEVSAYAFLAFYGGEFGAEYAVPCWSIPGGLAAVARAARERLGADRLITNSLVAGVENDERGGAVVRYVDAGGALRTLRASRVIVAVQKRIARKIVRGLPAAQDAAMKAVRYAPYVTVLLRTSAPLFGAGIFDLWLPDAEGLVTDVLNPSAVAGDAPGGTYLLFSPVPEGERRMLESEEWLVRRAQRAAARLEQFLPGSEEKIDELAAFAWGHSMVIPSAGALATIAPLVSKPVGKITFAGADNDVAPGFENAILSGLGS